MTGVQPSPCLGKRKRGPTDAQLTKWHSAMEPAKAFLERSAVHAMRRACERGAGVHSVTADDIVRGICAAAKHAQA